MRSRAPHPVRRLAFGGIVVVVLGAAVACTASSSISASGFAGGSASSGSSGATPSPVPMDAGAGPAPLVACRFDGPSDAGELGDAGDPGDAGGDAGAPDGGDPCSIAPPLQCEGALTAVQYALGACGAGGRCVIAGVTRRSCPGGCFVQLDGGVGCNP